MRSSGRRSGMQIDIGWFGMSVVKAETRRPKSEGRRGAVEIDNKSIANNPASPPPLWHHPSSCISFLFALSFGLRISAFGLPSGPRDKGVASRSIQYEYNALIT